MHASLHAHPAFADLPAETFATLDAVAERRSYGAGALILEEGERSQDLYLIEEGTVVPFRQEVTGDAGPAREFRLSPLGTGQLLGEYAFLDGKPRSASVRAETDTVLIVLPHDRLLESRDGERIVGQLKGLIATVLVNRNRQMNDTVVDGLKKQIAAKEAQNQFGHFLMYTILLFLVSTFLFYIVAKDFVVDVYDPAFAWQAVLLLAPPSLLIIWLLHLPAADIGIRREGLWPSLREAGILSAVVAVPALAFIHWRGLPEGGAHLTLWFFFQYLLHCILQELGARGVLQGLFERFLDDRSGHRSVLMSSTLFSVLHLAFGLHAVILVFFSSILFGYFYRRHRNLAGVSLLHFVLGSLAAVMVLL